MIALSRARSQSLERVCHCSWLETHQRGLSIMTKPAMYPLQYSRGSRSAYPAPSGYKPLIPRRLQTDLSSKCLRRQQVQPAWKWIDHRTVTSSERLTAQRLLGSLTAGPLIVNLSPFKAQDPNRAKHARQ